MMRMMDCQGVSERLPWLLAGSLSAPEADEVRTHMKACPRCREELDETRRAAEVFGAHLSTTLLLDLAWDRPVAGPDSRLAESHLASCPECREELELARESRRLEPMDREASTPVRMKLPLPLLLPASLAAGLVVGYGLAGRGTPAPPPADPRVAQLEQESTRLRGLVETLESAARTARPRINLPLFELTPGLVRRGGAQEPTDVAIPAGATEVVLLLSAEDPADARASLAITDAAGREVWRTEGLVSGPPGGFVVTVPADMLPAGAYSIALERARGPRTDYRIRVRR
jgi:uncharacterized protein YbaR (Trm112 family)